MAQSSFLVPPIMEVHTPIQLITGGNVEISLRSKPYVDTWYVPGIVSLLGVKLLAVFFFKRVGGG